MDVLNYLEKCFAKLIEMQGQDCFLKVGSVPRIRVGGTVLPAPFEVLHEEAATEIVHYVLNDAQKYLLQKNHSVDFAFTLSSSGQRFRGNVFFQQGLYSLVLRRLWKAMPSFEELHIPQILKKIALERSGLVLIAGTVGTGKSTTINAMIDYMNHNTNRHIIMIEDPIEFLHHDDKCLINQREIGQDATDFHSALKYVVRQSPDVIVIGEMRDRETFEFALAASEVGRLVISTVHARTVTQIFDRVLNFFLPEQREGVLNYLCFHITCFIAQKLLLGKDRKTLCPAFEVMLGTEMIRDLVHKRHFDKIPQALRNANLEGMQTMDQSILNLWQTGVVSEEEALAASEKPQEFLKLIHGIHLDEHRSKILDT